MDVTLRGKRNFTSGLHNSLNVENFFQQRSKEEIPMEKGSVALKMEEGVTAQGI